MRARAARERARARPSPGEAVHVGSDHDGNQRVVELMRLLPIVLPVVALAAACSGAEEVTAEETEERLCSAAEAGAVTAEKADALLKAVTRANSTDRAAACAKFKEVIEDGRKANIGKASGCRWDSRNSNGNPHFLISLHLTQLKGKARQTCRNLG